MQSIYTREPQLEDEKQFLAAVHASQALHQPWMQAPQSHAEFVDYIQRYRQANMKSLLVFTADNQLIGVFNLSEIVRGCFQNAYLGYFAVKAFAGQGLMSQALKHILEKCFVEMKLHRVEANIQPGNLPSIYLVRQNGFRKEGFSPRYIQIEGEWRDHERWAITFEDWIQLPHKNTSIPHQPE